MKRILIVSYYYSPANMMGAVRASKLSKYMEKKGYSVDVICSRNNNQLYLPTKPLVDENLIRDTEKINKIVIDHSKYYSFLASKIERMLVKGFSVNRNSHQELSSKVEKRNKKNKLLKKSLHFFSYIMSIFQDIDFYLQAKKVNLSEDYDSVISTYGPVGSLFVGNYIKKKRPNIKWIADFRDPIAQPTNSLIEYKINKFIEKKIIEKADEITAVSKGYLSEILRNSNKKGIVITNGFDKDDIKLSNDVKLDENILSFVYTGTTYAGKRKIEIIFKIISELITEGQVDEEKIVFNYAGPEEDLITALSIKHNISKNIKSYGLVDRKTALEIQSRSDILCVATWNIKGHTGVLPGKFLEYLYYNKPILSIVTGDLSKSEITNIIEEEKIGFAFEMINGNSNYDHLKSYILESYQQKIIEKRSLAIKKENDNLEKYNYFNITERFLELIYSERIN